MQYNSPGIPVDLSEANLFFCGCGDCGGWWFTHALDYFQNTGVVDEECYPYASGVSKKNCTGLCSDSACRIVKITGYTNLTNNDAAIKQHISTLGPVCACFDL